MADIKWIKLAIDIFDNRKIRQIECLPDGDAIIVIWMKLLCLAGVVNDNGQIYLTPEVAYTDEMLANQFNRPLATVKVALKVFEQFGMIRMIDNIMEISNWEKYQSVEELNKIKEQTRLRVARYRERKKLSLEAPSNVTCNVTVTECNGTEEEREEERDKEKEIRERVDFSSIVDAYHQHCPSFSRVRNLSDARKKAIKARLKTYSEEDLIEAFDKAESSTFLKGGNDRNWTADFDWILKDANLAKILDGKYDNAFQKETKKEVNSDAWSTAWEQVQMLIRRYGRTNAAKAYAEMDDITTATVKRLGYVNLCNSENVVSERANFRSIYEGIQNGK